MNERVLEIVFYIFDSMNSTNEENIINELQLLSKELIEKGFTENEINSAFDWVVENIDEINEENQLNLKNQLPLLNSQQWSDHTKTNNNSDSHDLVVQLRELDIIGEAEIEQIMDHSLKQGKHGTSISEIKAMVNNLILTPDSQSFGSFFVINSKNHVH